ncbi:hypothetical protein IC582_024563 [Cucumis melo]
MRLSSIPAADVGFLCRWHLSNSPYDKVLLSITCLVVIRRIINYGIWILKLRKEEFVNVGFVYIAYFFASFVI